MPDTHTVKCAFKIVVGMGNRMHPLTLTTLNPLISVNGMRMIDTINDGLLDNGIWDINIVTGYLADAFNTFFEKYPMINSINNPVYDKFNSISSLYATREHLDNDVIITNADLIIYNKSILAPVFT